MPAASVMPRERSAMIRATGWIIAEVWPSCITVPLTRVTSRSACGSGTDAAGASGPIGQKVSKLLPRLNWPPDPSRCHQRALTSLAAA